MASTIEWDKLPVISPSYKNRYGNAPRIRTLTLGTRKRHVTIRWERKPTPAEFERNWKKQFEKEYLAELSEPITKNLPAVYEYPKTAGAGPLYTMPDDLDGVLKLHCALDLPDEATPEPAVKTKKTKKKGRDNGSS